MWKAAYGIYVFYWIIKERLSESDCRVQCGGRRGGPLPRNSAVLGNPQLRLSGSEKSEGSPAGRRGQTDIRANGCSTAGGGKGRGPTGRDRQRRDLSSDPRFGRRRRAGILQDTVSYAHAPPFRPCSAGGVCCHRETC